MIKKIKILVLLIYLPLLLGNNSINTYRYELPKNIEELNIAYATLVEGATAKKYNRFISEISIFIEPSENVHFPDLLNIEKPDAQLYFFDIQDIDTIAGVEIDSESMEILDCTFQDPMDGGAYKIVKFQKNVIDKKGKVKTTFNQYLKIGYRSGVPKIQEVFNDSEENRNYIIEPCLKTKIDIEKAEKLRIKIEALQQQAVDYYEKSNYLKSLLVLNNAKKLNPNNNTTIEYLEFANSAINSSYINTTLEDLLKKKPNEAKNALELYKNFNLLTSNDYTNWQQKIDKRKIEIKQNLKYEEAIYYLSENMATQALEIFQNLKLNGFTHRELNNNITKAKEADPRYVQKQLKLAYKAAVASKKNAPSTFKTYYKYENSGYLNGDNYLFMCYQMVGSGNKRLLKEMNLSPNQAKNLAIKYFYKAKNLGEDVSKVENQVFTRNFDKNRKN